MNRQIVVVGDIILDKRTTVKVRGVSPENTAVVVAREELQSYGLGGAANVSHNVKTLGGEPVLLGFHDSGPVSRLLEIAGISNETELPEHGTTPIKNRIVTTDGHYLLRLDREDVSCGRNRKYWDSGGGRLGKRFRDTMFSGSGIQPVVCLVDYGKGCLTNAAVCSLMHQVNMVHESFKFPVIVDPGRDGDWEKYGSPRTIFRANLHQVMQHFSHNAADNYHSIRAPYARNFDPARVHALDVYAEILDNVIQNLKTCRTNFAYVVLTLGPGGLIFGGQIQGEWRYVPTEKIGVADPCGAGDAVTAAMAVTLAQTPNDPLDFTSLYHAVRIAERAASVAVRTPGVHAVKREDIKWTI